ncbi:MAG: hypothetical protein NHB32_09910 [Fischerella sp. CENA71]|nr:hypothetical protein [Fischerella sp. CENA71]
MSNLKLLAPGVNIGTSLLVAAFRFFAPDFNNFAFLIQSQELGLPVKDVTTYL